MAAFAWPEGIVRVDIHGDYLDRLVLPEGVQDVVCTGLGLRELVLPSTIQCVYASRNNIREIVVPHTIFILKLDLNPLYSIRFSGGDPLGMMGLDVRDTFINALLIRVHDDIDLQATACKYLAYVTQQIADIIHKDAERPMYKWEIVDPDTQVPMDQQERLAKALHLCS